MLREKIPIKVLMVALATSTPGCSSDERLVHQAELASERQAEQNRQIAYQNQQLAEATKQLVAADAQSRQETIAMQRDLQAEHVKVGQERDKLESERRDQAIQRQRDPIVAAAIMNLGLLLACLLPLVLCWYLLRGLRNEPNDKELAELLVVELASESPLLLPGPDQGTAPLPKLPARTAPKELPGNETSEGAAL